MAGWDDDFDDVDGDWPEPFGPGVTLVCRCHCVEEHEIEALADQGCDVAEIARRTGATTGCSGCRLQVEAIVASRRRVG